MRPDLVKLGHSPKPKVAPYIPSSHFDLMMFGRGALAGFSLSACSRASSAIAHPSLAARHITKQSSVSARRPGMRSNLGSGRPRRYLITRRSLASCSKYSGPRALENRIIFPR
jgi:hypothetical protein